MKLQVMDESDDEDVDYKGHFSAECSTTPPPSGMHGWVRGKLDLGVNSAKTKIERV